LGIEELPEVYMASVEFNGVIREELDSAPSPFREVWNMTKPRNGNSGWLVAGVQALQKIQGYLAQRLAQVSLSGIIGGYGNTVPFFFGWRSSREIRRKHTSSRLGC
jgi:hypothetical protein